MPKKKIKRNGCCYSFALLFSIKLTRKITGILLFLLLTTPVVVSYIFLHYQKKTIRHEVKHHILENLRREELTVLTFAKVDVARKLRWKHAREFEWEGNMYDVIKTETSANTVTYICFKDDDETEINKKIEGLLSSMWESNPAKKEHQQQLISLYKSLFFNPIKLIYQPLLHRPKFNFHHLLLVISNPGHQPPSPPPKHFLIR